MRRPTDLTPYVALFAASLALVPVQLKADGQFMRIEVHSPSLEGNLLGDRADRSVSIYLPPSYAQDTERRYPVLYHLHGFTMTDRDFTGTGIFGGVFNITDEIERFMAARPDREMILVFPNAHNRFRGSMYANSATTGNWADFIARDLVAYVDANYRTVADVEHRGLSGYSMGGSGALRVALRHPGVFGSVYSQSGRLGLERERLFQKEKAWRKILSLTRLNQFGLADAGLVATAAAFSPNPDRPPFFADYPVELVGDEFTVVEDVWHRWLSQDVSVLAVERKQSLTALRALQFDVGTKDDFGLDRPNVRFSKTLSEAGIPHVFKPYAGTHADRIVERTETELLPFFARTLWGVTPRVAAATVDLGTILAGEGLPEVRVVLDGTEQSAGVDPELSLDLTPLGGPQSVPLQHAGAGPFTVHADLAPERSGYYRLPVLAHVDGEPPFQLLQAALTVWPAADLTILADGVAPGWTMRPQLKVQVDEAATAQVLQGQTSMALALDGNWRLTLTPPEPVDAVGYTALLLAFHPGDASGSLLEMKVGERRVDLLAEQAGGLVLDLEEKTWQSFEIPVDAEEPLSSIVLTGKLEGTIYLDDIRLLAAPRPVRETAVVETRTDAAAAGFVLDPNYPNPFNSGTVIPFSLPRGNVVELVLYDLLGQRVATLVRGARPAGAYAIAWDGRDEAGRQLASGTYLYRLRTDDGVLTRKLLLLR